MQVADFILQVLNQLARLLFLVLGGFDESPSLIDLAFEDRDSVAVLLG